MQYPLQYLSLLSAIYNSLVEQFPKFGSVNAMRDIATIARRAEHEGISFLTIALPGFADDVFSALEEGSTSSFFKGLKKAPKSCLPKLFIGLTSYVFDSTGTVLTHPCPHALGAIRQLCYLLKKISLPCSEERTLKALVDYAITDQEVKNVIPEDFRGIGRCIVSMLFPRPLLSDDIIPHPGKGAIWEKFPKFNQRYYSLVHASGLREFFGEALHTTSEEYIFNGLVQEGVVYDAPLRVTTVPKTLKAPRVIAVEPNWTMFYQQGLKDLLVETMESHALTKGHINFRDQSVNKVLALKQSVKKELATVDMKEASDRISNAAVIDVFSVNRFICDALQATRTGEAYVPHLGVLSLNKFASMGSATCFPVEALMFFIGAITAMHRADGCHWTSSSIRKYSKKVWVYGDDIIIPVKYISAFTSLSTDIGWRLNSRKSFYRSAFRESCGCDAYEGLDITPTYLRQPFMASGENTRKKAGMRPRDLISHVSTANQLWAKGFNLAAYFLAKHVTDLSGLSVKTRPLEELNGGIWFDFPWDDRVEKRYVSQSAANKNCYQTLEFRGLVFEPKRTEDSIDGPQALMKHFCKRQKKPDTEYDIERMVLRGEGRIKTRWISPTWGI